MHNLEQILSSLPNKCGVYQFKDAYSRVIYVGKANNLRQRVRSYFRDEKADSKACHIARAAADIEIIVTDNELEALILECNLIKQYNPRYNVLLKDGKSYPYLKITLGEPFPRLFITRELKKDGHKYFGPFNPAFSLREIYGIIRKFWHVRQCNKPLTGELTSPCLNYHIGKCKAPCAGLISKDEYREIINEIILFLNGGYEQIIKNLETHMLALAENLQFEEAAYIRDHINVIQNLRDKQKVDTLTDKNLDIIALAVNAEFVLFYIFFVRGGKITGSEHFIPSAAYTRDKSELMASFIKLYYNESFIPDEIIADTAPHDAALIENYLSGLRQKKVAIRVPKKGFKYNLVVLANKNAELTLQNKAEKTRVETEKLSRAHAELTAALGLTALTRIEAYDISNTSGVLSVGSMVVFEDLLPKHKDYRKFKIKTGTDDCKCLAEVLTRRFTRYIDSNTENNSFDFLPDLILIDGGAAQVSAAEAALLQFGLNIPVCGMVKDDKHKFRVLYYGRGETELPRGSEGFLFIVRVQDEAHRFAVSFHKNLRSKEMVKSVLDDIPGIGPTRRNALLAHFGSLEKIRIADIEELTRVKGMTNAAARAVCKFFDQKRD